MRIVVALGGNALSGAARRSVRRPAPTPPAPPSARAADRRARGVLTHGNGPQVGLLLNETERTARPYPLDILGAESEGMVGYIIEQDPRRQSPGRSFATLLTQTVVDATTRRSACRRSRSARFLTRPPPRVATGDSPSHRTRGVAPRRPVPVRPPVRVRPSRPRRRWLHGDRLGRRRRTGDVDEEAGRGWRPSSTRISPRRCSRARSARHAPPADRRRRVYRAFGSADAHGLDKLTSRTGTISSARARACSRKHAPEGRCVCGIRRFRRHRDHPPRSITRPMRFAVPPARAWCRARCISAASTA